MYTKVIDFLIRAKKATYAGKGAQAPSSRINSHDYNYAEEGLLYLDTYLGGEKFAGEEAVWQENTPIWSMNYVGRVVAEGFSGDFLKEALLRVPEEYPYRGPLEYTNGVFAYRCTVNGDFEWYYGSEVILKNGEIVYECLFHGGIIR